MGEHYLTTHIDSVQQLVSITLRRSSSAVVSSMSWVLQGLVKECVSALVTAACSKFPTVGTGYQYCCTFRTLRSGTVTVTSVADLEVFDDEHLARGSLITDHSVMTYFKQLQVSAATWAFGKDMHSKIATFDIRRPKCSFLHELFRPVARSPVAHSARSPKSSDDLPKVALVANRKALNALAGDGGCTLPFPLITFNVNSTNGKNFLITELLGHESQQTPYVESSSKFCKGATTGDCSVFPLLQRDADSDDSWLSEHFEDVRFVQICTKGQPRYSVRLAEFRQLPIQVMDCNLKSQKIQLCLNVNKAGWCQAAKQVIEEIGYGEDIGDYQQSFLVCRHQVNMFDVYAELMDKRVRFFFTDTLDVFRGYRTILTMKA